jgi:hypothetical protein
MNNHHQQEENAAAGALAERMVNVLTLHDNDDKKKEEDEDTKNAGKDKKKKPVANDANDISLEDDASPLNLDQSTTTSTLAVKKNNAEAVDNAKAANQALLARLACFELTVLAHDESNGHDSHAIDVSKQEMMVVWQLPLDLEADEFEEGTLVGMNWRQQCWHIHFSRLSKSHVRIRSGLGHGYFMALADLDFYVIVGRIQVDRPDHHEAPKYGFEMHLLGHSDDHPFLLFGHFPDGTNISPQQFGQLAGLSDQNVRDKFGLLAADDTTECALFADETVECIKCEEELIPVDQRVLEETFGRDLVVHLSDIRCPFGMIRRVCEMLDTAKPRLSLRQLFDHDIVEKE